MTLAQALAIAAGVGWSGVVGLVFWIVRENKLRSDLEMVNTATALAYHRRTEEIQRDLDAAKDSIARQSAALDAQAQALSISAADKMAETKGLDEEQLRESLRRLGLLS